MRGATGWWARGAILAIAASMSACEAPFLAKDGTVVFPEHGARGAAVLTANGVEFRDRMDVPQRVVARDPYEAWRAPVGFILPASGRFTVTSRPVVIAPARSAAQPVVAAPAANLVVVMRPSDTRVPSWGGEVLIRVDLLAPAAANAARWGEEVAVVVEGRGRDTAELADAVVAQLSGRDRVTVIDARGARVVVPPMPASNRSMAQAALAKRLGDRAASGARDDLPRALDLARASLGKTTLRRVVVLSDKKAFEPLSREAEAALERLRAEHVQVSAVATEPWGDERAMAVRAPGGEYSAAEDVAAHAAAVRRAVPAAGELAFRDVVLTFAGSPAPSHVIEASGGDVRWKLDAGELGLGDVRAGDARTEVVRVTVPAWVPGEDFVFTVTARYDDLGHGGERREIVAEVPCVYDDDIERIAESRHGDVIAYASALATLKRLDAAFVGPGVAQSGGLQRLAELHAGSMELLARDMRDPQIKEQADMLKALLQATR